jgi:ornithine--oxo-acid transaminase
VRATCWSPSGSCSPAPGFRTDLAAHLEAQDHFGRPVITLQLVDPRYYHLDTALTVLGDTIAFLPEAFTISSVRVLRQLFPEAIEASAADAAVLGLNAVSDGHHVVMPVQATGLAKQLAARGYEPVPVDLSELLKAGGGPKCCTPGTEERVMTMTTNRTAAAVAEAERWTAHNYHPLPVVIADADGAWVTDVDGRRYLDCLAGYSALNFGHRHPALIDAARKQIEHVTLTSRAFLHDQFGPFCRDLAALCGMDMVLPMNTGAEAVETAIKVSRKWGYKVKGVPDGQASIVVAADNFHGRTTTIISFSTDPDARADYGPYTPGFRIVPYGDLEAMRAAIDDTTVAVLIEPIQGEAGVLVPPPGYLTGVRELCTELNVLFVADEIQSGLGRTGDTFACDHEGVKPDMYVLGKALGGGVVPVSAVVSRADVLGVLRPGRARLDVRWQPARVRRRHLRHRPAELGRVPGAGPRTGRVAPRPAAFVDRSWRHRRTGSGPVGRHRHRPHPDDRARGV